MKNRFLAAWARVPARVRKTIVLVVGFTLVALGVALVVLPGPFTLPLLLAGFAVLATEFVWAATVLERSQRAMKKTATVVRRSASGVKNAAGKVRRPR
jgi:uncharacterized membrane protein YbaN (DUF454 family)